MFKSKRRAIVIPQSEHLRLVGILAMLWGNEDFDTPPIDRSSMIIGMGLHDRGYGYLDNLAIGSMSEAEWNEVARRSFHMQYSDVVGDTIAKYHVRRLASHDPSQERRTMTADFSQAVEKQLQQHNLSGRLFERIDRITEFCDKVSFDFCMDVPGSGGVSIYRRNSGDEEVLVKYHVEDGVIHAAPWPFSVTHYESYLIAYRSDGYPETLDPFILPCLLEQTSDSPQTFPAATNTGRWTAI